MEDGLLRSFKSWMHFHFCSILLLSCKSRHWLLSLLLLISLITFAQSSSLHWLRTRNATGHLQMMHEIQINKFEKYLNKYGLYISIVTEIDLSFFGFWLKLEHILILTAVAGVVGGLGGKFGLYIIDVIEVVLSVFVFDFLWDTLSFWGGCGCCGCTGWKIEALVSSPDGGQGNALG